MLTQRTEPTTPFTRRDAGRLSWPPASARLILTAIFAVDIVPSGLGLQVGEVAVADVVAPAHDHVHEPDPDRGRPGGRPGGVQPRYDYTQAQARRDRRPPGRGLRPRGRPGRCGLRQVGLAAARAALLKVVLPALSDSGRKTLEGLSPADWKALRDEAANVLDQVERAELRDSDVPTVASGSEPGPRRPPGRPEEAGRRAHRAAPRPELGVQRVPDRAGPGRRGPGGPSAQGHDPAGRERHRQGPPDHARADGEWSRPSTSTRRRSTWPGSVATSS